MKLGYSKINIIDTHKSKSLDFSSDLPMSFPQTTPNSSRSKIHLDQIIKTNTDATVTKETTNKTTQADNSSSSSSLSSSSSSSPRKRNDDHDHREEVENVNGDIARKADKAAFGSSSNNAVLGRNSSVSNSMSAVKRVLSMRRSSSVSERYCRIHDQSVTLASPIDDEDDELEEDKTRSGKKKKHGGGKILKACKRLFGLR
ncbi:hypothetical protein L484_001375 [Morus notabilis]|uniref:Uncharacterized protein n=1 Tax=Morus notabilis TaxID=981085 RepID=W9QEB7_9ROSA|nr:uncharacterized protein DDB_G0271670 [Morus notabilis]EXB30760.1 hypothetical protein L484_001375 [Morus notabilis]